MKNNIQSLKAIVYTNFQIISCIKKKNRLLFYYYYKWGKTTKVL